jgi:hypothetical protein
MMMADTNDRAQQEQGAALPADPAEDHRRPYESPQIMKKRSVNSATLFTAMTVASMGLTFMG